jgi:hypothetical protein
MLSGSRATPRTAACPRAARPRRPTPASSPRSTGAPRGRPARLAARAERLPTPPPPKPPRPRRPRPSPILPPYRTLTPFLLHPPQLHRPRHCYRPSVCVPEDVQQRVPRAVHHAGQRVSSRSMRFGSAGPGQQNPRCWPALQGCSPQLTQWLTAVGRASLGSTRPSPGPTTTRPCRPCGPTRSPLPARCRCKRWQPRSAPPLSPAGFAPRGGAEPSNPRPPPRPPGRRTNAGAPPKRPFLFATSRCVRGPAPGCADRGRPARPPLRPAHALCHTVAAQASGEAAREGPPRPSPLLLGLP